MTERAIAVARRRRPAKVRFGVSARSGACLGAGSGSGGFRRLQALGSLLLAAVATPLPAEAQDRSLRPGELLPRPPRNADECGMVFDQVANTVMDTAPGVDSAVALVNFMMATNADNILRDLCNKGAYLQAFELGNNYIEGERHHAPPPRKNPGQCFLTTACCGLIGLDDDCFELRALRAFRDDVLRDAPGGRRDIALYYVAAPAILAAMRAAGRERELLRYYASHILPCAVMARMGLKTATRLLYRDLMRRLCRAYGLESALFGSA